jgi:5-methylcytosine-specific restriction endonuclease McrA
MLKYSTGNSKKNIIDNIMNYNSKCETLQLIKSINYNTFPKDNKPTEFNIEQPPQVKEDERIKEFGRLQKEKKQPKEKHPRPVLEAAVAAEAELKEKQRRQEVEAEAELKEKQRLQEEDEQKKKKSKIPKNVKINVWNTHIDPNIQRHKCLCCKKSIISITEFHVGHVISENAGGTLEINNLRPICASCNYSMGTTNMIDYIVKYGYYL